MDLEGKRIMVTGSSGFMGKLLTEELSKSDVEIIGFDVSEGNDIRKWNQVSDIKDIDLIYHLAAITNIPYSYEHPRETYDVNVLGTLNVLELCRLSDAKIIMPSTAYVYGRPEYLPIDEEHTLDPTNPYSKSKLIGENLLKNYNEDYGVKSIILRLFNVYGEDMGKDSLIPHIIKQIRDGEEIVVRDLVPKRDFVYVGDVIDAYLIAAEYDQTDFEIFNIGSGTSHSVKEVIDLLIAGCEKNFNLKAQNKRRKDEVLDIVADITKAESILNWTPKTTIANGLSRVLKCNV